MSSLKQISLRKHLSLTLGSYNDRNDGFCRTYFSRSKANNARIRKVGKVKRVKAPHKTWEQAAA